MVFGIVSFFGKVLFALFHVVHQFVKVPAIDAAFEDAANEVN